MPDATPFHVSVDASGPTSGVATLTLEQGDRPVVVLDLALIQRLEATLRSLPHGILGLVVVSAAPRAFVAGADLRSITELDDAALERYLAYGSRVFGMLSQLPFPTAAAIHAAVLGGGGFVEGEG
jgi:enoyl-CoA hydratase